MKSEQRHPTSFLLCQWLVKVSLDATVQMYICLVIRMDEIY
jgi:hypothetical protein